MSRERLFASFHFKRPHRTCKKLQKHKNTVFSQQQAPGWESPRPLQGPCWGYGTHSQGEWTSSPITRGRKCSDICKNKKLRFVVTPFDSRVAEGVWSQSRKNSRSNDVRQSDIPLFNPALEHPCQEQLTEKRMWHKKQLCKKKCGWRLQETIVGLARESSQITINLIWVVEIVGMELFNILKELQWLFEVVLLIASPDDVSAEGALLNLRRKTKQEVILYCTFKEVW